MPPISGRASADTIATRSGPRRVGLIAHLHAVENLDTVENYAKSFEAGTTFSDSMPQ
jgi:hypothetical protein